MKASWRGRSGSFAPSVMPGVASRNGVAPHDDTAPATGRFLLHDHHAVVPAPATAGIFVAGASRQLIHAHTSGARPRAHSSGCGP